MQGAFSTDANTSREFLRCIVELDVSGIRKLWHQVQPNMPQPETNDDALVSLHLARLEIPILPLKLRAYSYAWLKERQSGRVALAVGISVNAPARRRQQALSLQGEMELAVTNALRDGVDLATEAEEIRKRMIRAREKA